MLKSFIAIALRHLHKNKGYTLLNIFGLSVGIACFVLITLWMRHELSYDTFHTQADRLYRVASNFTDESGQFNQAVTCIPLGPALAQDLPEVEEFLRIDVNDAIVQLGEKQFEEDDILGVDPSFFSIFSFKLLKGSAETALIEPYSIVVSESMARKYFGDRDPLGQSLKIFQYDPDGQGAEYKVTGVIEDCPTNSHLKYNFLFSFKTIEVADPGNFGYDGWFNNGYYTYVLLYDHVSPDAIKEKLSGFAKRYIGDVMEKYNVFWSYFLQPVADIHLESHLRYEIQPTSSKTYVRIFGVIGLAVLLLACVNYINLATASSSKRFREVGVRKVMGAFKRQLIGQFLAESWLLAMLSLLLAIVWIEVSRPVFESLTGYPIGNLYTPSTAVLLISITSAVGLASGVFPAFVLTAVNAVRILKGQYSSGNTGALVRKSLVVFQYTISIVLLTGIIVVQLQWNFIKDKDLGFTEENLLVLKVNGSTEVMAGYEAFANELLTNRVATGIARSNTMIAGGLGNSTGSLVDASGKTVNGTIYRLGVDDAYVETYQMSIIAGRNFSPGRVDSSGFIVNAATAKAYGYQNPADIVGTRFHMMGIEGTVIGVVNDFHYNSLQKSIEPTAMYLLGRGFSRINVRLPDSTPESVAAVASAWKNHFPNSLLKYTFAEESLEGQYRAERRFSQVFFIFTLVSITIASLGLFALVSYSVQRRTKEIGIRKVLGASSTRIIVLVAREFLLLVAISCAIASPIAYYLMRQWLEAFAYKIVIQPWMLFSAGVAAILIATITIGLKSLKAANTNPVNVLRTE